MAKPSTIHPSIIPRLDTEYATFHNKYIIHLPQVHELPWNPSVRNIFAIPGSSDPLPVGKVEDFNLSRCRIRAFVPEGPRPQRGWPVFIFFHGGTGAIPYGPNLFSCHRAIGGWTLGNINTANGFCTHLCKSKGNVVIISFHGISPTLSGVKCVIVSVDYRLAPENPYPEAVEDAVEALQWVWQQGASTLGVDTNRIAVGGSSRYVSPLVINSHEMLIAKGFMQWG